VAFITGASGHIVCCASGAQGVAMRESVGKAVLFRFRSIIG